MCWDLAWITLFLYVARLRAINNNIKNFAKTNSKWRASWQSFNSKHCLLCSQSYRASWYSFIHLLVCFTTGPNPLPKRALHIVRYRASSFKWEYPLLSLRSSSSFLRLLPRLPVTSIPPFIFPSITRCRRQFLRKMWPMQFAFRLRISCRIFLCSLTLSNTSSFFTWSVQMIFSILLQHHISKLSRCFWSTARSVQVSFKILLSNWIHHQIILD